MMGRGQAKATKHIAIIDKICHTNKNESHEYKERE